MCTCIYFNQFTGTETYLEIRPAERSGRWQNSEMISHQLSHSINNKAKWVRVKSAGRGEMKAEAAATFVGEEKPLCCAAGRCADPSDEIQIAN